MAATETIDFQSAVQPGLAGFLALVPSLKPAAGSSVWTGQYSRRKRPNDIAFALSVVLPAAPRPNGFWVGL